MGESIEAPGLFPKHVAVVTPEGGLVGVEGGCGSVRMEGVEREVGLEDG